MATNSENVVIYCYRFTLNNAPYMSQRVHDSKRMHKACSLRHTAQAQTNVKGKIGDLYYHPSAVGRIVSRRRRRRRSWSPGLIVRTNRNQTKIPSLTPGLSTTAGVSSVVTAGAARLSTHILRRRASPHLRSYAEFLRSFSLPPWTTVGREVRPTG